MASLLTQGSVVLVLALFYSYKTGTGPFKTQLDILNIAKQVDDVYDYVIIGGGSAGSVLASRLSEYHDIKVLLLEAGNHYNNYPMIDVPAYGPDLLKTEIDWAYYTESQTHSNLGMKEQKSFWPRGKVLGGTSCLNGLQYTRGCPYEYDEWAANGCTGWSYRDVLPYFRKSEDIQIDELKSSIYHGSDGPIAVSAGRVTPLADLYMKAGQEIGYNITDYNGINQVGFSPVQVTVRNGIRSSTGLEYLGKIGERKNLHIALNSFATKVNIKENVAVGAFYVRNGKKHYVNARKEVILSAGALNSPQLLMLSGIGPKKHLDELSIPVIADLPVGENLQDHIMAFLFSRINKPYSITDDVLNSWWTLFQYHVLGRGPLAIAGTDGSGFLYLDENKDKTTADIQAFMDSSFVSKNYFNYKESVAKEYLAEKPDVHGINFIVSVTHPKSRGTIRLRSTDPFDYPILDPKYLTDRRDVEKFIGGIRLWEKFAKTSTMKDLGVNINQMKMSFCSKHTFRSNAYWECFVRHLAVTVYHHACTCKMGSDDDPTSVVDTNLRVKGINSLRVIDASVFPNITSGNINAPTIMVAERAADLINGKVTVH